MAFRIPALDVLDANSFLNCNDIWPGTPICIYGKSQVTVTVPPAASTTVAGSGTCWTNYRSHPGDTCKTIAERFGMSPEAVWNANKFLDCNNIWDGTPITICDGARTRTTVVNYTTGFATNATWTPVPTWSATNATWTPVPTWSATNATWTPVPTWSASNATWTPVPTWSATNATWTPIPTWTATNATTTRRTSSSSAPSATPTTCWTTYISKPGDDCNSISEAFRITSSDVFDANTFLNCNDIWPGTPICIYGKSQVTVTGLPPSTPTTIGGAVCWTNYRSQLYDTCKSIGARFGITAEQVYNANKFLNCNDIWEGTPIAICK
ncbi:SubName: Full=Uncharacterized protein {ECO:0000313/EMBL:CCA74762.1} [Serendipita indica DSM 11827]|nr:SubName: Full=Uncharacterized protein {ECO:0000313/EMBL:CCA74762.1} [Serendipita indica DSM 11827]